MRPTRISSAGWRRARKPRSIRMLRRARPSSLPSCPKSFLPNRRCFRRNTRRCISCLPGSTGRIRRAGRSFFWKAERGCKCTGLRYSNRRRPWGAAATNQTVEKVKGETMKVRIALLATALMFAGSAFAFHCPQDMKKIDDALAKNPKLTDAQMAEVKKDRAEGEALHKAGKHQESIDTLAKAEKILGIQ